MADTEPKFSEFPFSIWLESVIREWFDFIRNNRDLIAETLMEDGDEEEGEEE